MTDVKNIKENKFDIKVNFNPEKEKFIISYKDVLNFAFAKTDDKTLRYTYSIKPDKASSITEVIQVCTFCECLLSGKISDGNEVIFEYIPNEKANRDKKSVAYLKSYWTKIYRLEQLFQREFSPSEIVKNYDKEYFAFIRLVRCLLDKKPYRIDDFSLGEVTLETTNETVIKKIQSQKTSNFVFKEETTLIFASQELHLYKIRCLFKIAADNVDIIDKDDGTKKVIITVDNDNDDMYLAEQLFLNEADTDAAKVGDKLQQIANAKPL